MAPATFPITAMGPLALSTKRTLSKDKNWAKLRAGGKPLRAKEKLPSPQQSFNV
jgi:hypothetical protein